MSLETLSREVAELKRRLDLAETKAAQQAGQFEFISGQLRDVQLYPHARFGDMDEQFGKINERLRNMDGRFDRVDRRFDSMDAKLDAMPRVIAELIAGRLT